MSHLFPNYTRSSIEIVSGDGNYLMDQNENRYLDFTSGIGVCNLGYNHPQVKLAVEAQLNQIWHMPNLYQSHLQEKVAEKLSLNDEYLGFFCNSGAEANEAALKLARKASGKTQIITFENSFHGRTYGAMSATAQAKIQNGFEPLVPDFVYVPYNDFAALEKVASEKTAAIMLEIVQGEGGILLADHEWVKNVAKLCQEKGILLIVDEIQTGLGRSGTLYAFQQYGISPDIFTLAKGLGNGIPVGAMMGKKALGPAFGPGSHGSTFGGNKIALAAANEVLLIIDNPAFLEEVREKSQLLIAELAEKIGDSASVKAIRHLGLMVGIEVAGDVPTYMRQMEDKGLLVLRAGADVIRLLPPLTITKEQIVDGVNIIAEVLI